MLIVPPGRAQNFGVTSIFQRPLALCFGIVPAPKYNDGKHKDFLWQSYLTRVNLPF